MHYSREILKKNRIWVFIYISLGIFNAFLANYKADFSKESLTDWPIRHLLFLVLYYMALFCWSTTA